MRHALIALPAAALLALSASAAPPVKTSAAQRGKYLALIGGCSDCHTPKKMGPQGPEADTTRLLSGHPQGEPVTAQATLSAPWMAATNMHLTAWSGPWGISYAANLTPDPVTGLGVPNLWTEALFIKAMRTGKHIGTSRPILPPMPWQEIAQMTDQDLKALWAYLRSIPPVRNQVPDPVMAPPPPGPPGAPAAAPPSTK
jgi:cytochrome c553